MKNYERPIVMINEDLAEGVYAASGAGVVPDDPQATAEPVCWTVDVQKYQSLPGDGYSRFRIYAWHKEVLHISSASTVVITFTQPVTDVIAQGFDVSISDKIVTIVRNNDANAERSKDEYTCDVQVYSEDPDAMNYTSAVISCTSRPNVKNEMD